MERQKRLLVVDDEEVNRELLTAMVRSLGHECETAHDGIEALAKLHLDIDLVLMDVTMPGMDGFEVTHRMRDDPVTADIPVIMVTGLASREHRLRAVEAGANDFIEKPVDLTELKVRSTSLLRMKEAQDAIKRHREELERTVEQRTAALRESLESMVKAQQETYEAHLDTIRRLATAAEYRDYDTAAHLDRVSGYCTILGESLHLPPGEVEVLKVASSMHDVGKLGVSDAILFKPGKLTPEETAAMQQHCEIGARILGGSQSQLLQAGQVIALSHHERWDGKGYPKGLRGNDIPLFGRICAVADVFDALTTRRPYREAMPEGKALAILREERGKHFDPDLVDRFTQHLDRVCTVQNEVQE